jgi:hypothetical protein
MNVPVTGPGIWKDRYESLRRHFLEDRQMLGTDPLGLVLFFRLGVAGWMRHWTTMPTASQAPVPLAQSFQPPPVMTAGWQHQLTVVLAQMTARHLPGSLTL